MRYRVWVSKAGNHQDFGSRTALIGALFELVYPPDFVPGMSIIIEPIDEHEEAELIAKGR